MLSRLALLLLCLTLCASCSTTKITTTTTDGRPVKVTTSADASAGFLVKTDSTGAVTLIAGSMDHSTPTKAQGSAIAAVGAKVLAMLDKYLVASWLINRDNVEADTEIAKTEAAAAESTAATSADVTKAGFTHEENMARIATE